MGDAAEQVKAKNDKGIFCFVVHSRILKNLSILTLCTFSKKFIHRNLAIVVGLIQYCIESCFANLCLYFLCFMKAIFTKIFSLIVYFFLYFVLFFVFWSINFYNLQYTIL